MNNTDYCVNCGVLIGEVSSENGMEVTPEFILEKTKFGKLHSVENLIDDDEEGNVLKSRWMDLMKREVEGEMRGEGCDVSVVGVGCDGVELPSNMSTDEVSEKLLSGLNGYMNICASTQEIDVGMDVQIERAEKYFEYLKESERNEEYPLCSVCMETVYTVCLKLLGEIELECTEYDDAYKRLLQLTESKEVEEGGRRESLFDSLLEGDANCRAVQYKEGSKGEYSSDDERGQSTHSSGLDVMQIEENNIFEEEVNLLCEAECLELAELKGWLEFTNYISDVTEHEEELAATKAYIDYATRQLEQLKVTEVMKDTFKITFEGPFGVINGLRMGRVPSCNTTWDEINAGWGQVCLMMEALLKKLSINLSLYKLEPRGSYSLVIRKSDNAQFELYSNEKLLSRLLSGRRFDEAMAAFLACMNEVLYHLNKRVSLGGDALQYPHIIEGDKIDGSSIRLQGNQSQRWTRTLKMMMWNLDWLAGYAEEKC